MTRRADDIATPEAEAANYAPQIRDILAGLSAVLPTCRQVRLEFLATWLARTRLPV